MDMKAHVHNPSTHCRGVYMKPLALHSVKALAKCEPAGAGVGIYTIYI